jgi:hypothetical protein
MAPNVEHESIDQDGPVEQHALPSLRYVGRIVDDDKGLCLETG